MLRKISVIMLALVVTLSMGITAFAEEVPLDTTDDVGYVAFAKDIVEKYYKNKDLGENNDFSKEVSNDALKLLNAKIELGQMQNKTLGYTYIDYQISVTPSLTEKWVKGETEILMYLRVERTWFYDNELYIERNTNKTTTSEVLKITVSKTAGNDLKMIECYDLDESITLGPIDELYQKAKASKLISDALIDDYKRDFQEGLTRKRNQMNMDAQKAQNINKIQAENRAYSSLNIDGIVDWARANYNKTSPTSSNASVPYYDFSQIPSAWDCTNFVSHALLAGGARLKDNGQSGIVGTNQWYYRSTANRSSSWAGVNELYSFLTRSNPGTSNIGPYVTEKALTWANGFRGDIVQAHNGSIWRHSTVITAYQYPDLLVTGRTNPNTNNNNVPATTIYNTQRLLHLEGTY
ncbi:MULTISPECIES: amidase domain-containing protein [unclassified Lysinibacillus]|uniref:amidase domain-containing protein n=1 Tax=unclassified Lysinibacillus TaxID=2636778 RepID=UPI003801C736